MRKLKKRNGNLRTLIIVFMISTLTLSIGYSLLYETLTIEGKGNIVYQPDTDQIMSKYLKFSYTSNKWYSSGKYYYQIDGSLENISDFEIENWKVILEFPENIVFQSGWNGEYLADVRKITITPASYNSVINPNSTTTIGFQIALSSDILNIEKTTLDGNIIGADPIGPNIPDPEDPIVPDIPDPVDPDPEIPSEINVTYEARSEWQSANKYISQYNFKIKNETNHVVNDWEFKIKLPNGVGISEIWSGNYINANGILKISGVSYNKTLQPSASTEVLIQFESNFRGYTPEIVK